VLVQLVVGAMFWKQVVESFAKKMNAENYEPFSLETKLQ
jgi:hypothetical protein